METTDLMIGDWVKSLKEDHSGEYGQVIDISHHDTVLLEYKCVNYYTDVEHIEPISLTPEILEKNGFVSKKGRFMQLGNFDNPPLILWHLVDDPILRHPKNQLEIHHGAESIHVSFMCHYVHQLQHALRLCGIDKELII